ncbi:MAG: dockerin type I repeat-containing protein [Verrucomicrobiota bacterium]|nr:dockerin type I repeat-containing protein [Verrucomicrobiota bacterium]
MKKLSTSQSAFFRFRIATGLLLVGSAAALAFLAFSRGASAQNGSGSRSPETVTAQYRGLAPVAKFDVSPPLRDIKPIDPTFQTKRENEDRDLGVPLRWRLAPEFDPVVQSQSAAVPLIPGPLVSFNAQSGTASPPDANMGVGTNHVVAMANSMFQIFNKSGTSLYGPAANNTLFAGFGGPCQTENAGDPVVVYDQLADRWILSQFTAAGPTYFFCMAVSTTPDPTGTYYRYAISTGGNFPDYPKMSMWPDAYYVSTREFQGSSGPFQGVGAYALNRAQAIAGNPNAQVISFIAPPTPAYNVGDGLLPSDFDGTNLPPAGSPAFYVGSMDNNGPYGAPQDALTLWKYVANFTNPSASSFTLTNTIPVAPFNSILALCAGGRACIPQQGSTTRLDHLGYRQRPLFRLAYRNFGTYESLVTNQSVSAGTGPSGEVSGIRWWEMRNPNSSPFIYQEGTYAPGLTDGIHRWMGSIAMNGAGDMGLGYSASSSTLFPSIYYTGRNASSALGQMTLGEAAIYNGTSPAAPAGNRWGDYTAIDVDPVDDATFWYINEYYAANTSTWTLRVGSFKTIPTPAFATGGSSLLAESCSPANGVADPGEMLTQNLCITNTGSLASSNTVGTLQNTGGVTNASGPQNFGAIAPGATVCRVFTYTANGSCGGTVTPTLQVNDPATTANVSYAAIPIGTLVTSFSENFDSVTPPALPNGWTADQGTNAGGSPLWVTSNSGVPAPVADSAPNSAFTPDPATVLDNRLYSPVVTYSSGAKLNFRHNYAFEATYDGGVLEMAVAGGAFADILAAGGTFAVGGYNQAALSSSFSNPLAGRAAWSGSSAGFVTTTVNLPASAAGQPVQFRWRMGSDTSVGSSGWRVDTVTISTPSCATSCAPTASSAVSRKNHGGTTFDIPLPLSGTPGIEDRRGTATNDHTIVVSFPGNVSVSGSPQAQVISGSAVVGSGGASNGGAVSVSGATITIPLTNVGNAQTIYVAVNGVTSGSSMGTVVVPMSLLLGDVTGDGTVNSADLTQTRARSGQGLDGTNFRSDITVDGLINSADATAVRSNSGNSLP